jgi:GNAT superfamily N-acetyltransferase
MNDVTPGTVREILLGETHLVHDAMSALRPAYDDAARFVERVDSLQRGEGHRLVASFREGSEPAAAVAGFRVGNSLSWGFYLCVDDLSTSPGHRGRGHARGLLEWLLAEARRLGCDQFHLDSGCGADRFDAHRLYYNNTLAITAHHFALRL